MAEWIKAGRIEDFVENAGSCIKHGDEQIAVFNYNKETWYAVQNLCPHKEQMVMSRGLIGDKEGEHKVACPLHKNNFSLKTGKHLGGDESWCLKTYSVKAEEGSVYVEV